MPHKKPFSLSKRGKFYYCQFRLPDGSRSNAKSTGETSKGRAETWAITYLQAGSGVIVTKENVTFGMFSKDFFSWGGEWATDKRVRGLRIGQRHCMERTDILKNHIVPFFEKLRLTAIDRATIKEFRNKMFRDGYSGNTINKCLSALKTILEAAEEKSLIRGIPRIDRAAENPKEKGILTLDESKRLFSFQWSSRPAFKHPAKPDFIGYAGNLTAYITGLRLSEIQGLLHKDIDIQNKTITVRRSWNSRLYCLNTETKSGKERTVFFPEMLRSVLVRLIETNPHGNSPDNFVFYGETPTRARDPRYFVESLNYALEQIGIDTEERKKRGISFHSSRHWLNSLLVNSKIPIQKIQSLVGHSDLKMTERYYHGDDFSDVLQVTEGIFSAGAVNGRTPEKDLTIQPIGGILTL